MIVYYKLDELLKRRGIKKKDLIDNVGLSSSTIAKLSNNKSVTTDVINRLCRFLNCQPGDIMAYEYAPEDPPEKLS